MPTPSSESQILDPAQWKNKRVGILGGSFNPPHAGHVHISEVALQTLRLDALWWLVTPCNPLKTEDNLLPLERRMDLSRGMLNHQPKIIVTALEESFQTRYSYDTIRALKQHYPHTDFAWITGMDNALTFHLWKNWRDILREICTVHIARGGVSDTLIDDCPLRTLSAQKHVNIARPAAVPLEPQTSYWLLNTGKMDLSSTKIREKTIIKQ